MSLIQVNWRPSTRELRQFAVIWLPCLLVLVGGLLLYNTGWLAAALVIWACSLVTLLAGLAAPERFRPLWVAWMAAAWPIAWLISHLILAVIFFLVVTPIGLVMRFLGRDPLARRFDRSAKSYWEPHEGTSDPARYFRQF